MHFSQNIHVTTCRLTADDANLRNYGISRGWRKFAAPALLWAATCQEGTVVTISRTSQTHVHLSNYNPRLLYSNVWGVRSISRAAWPLKDSSQSLSSPSCSLLLSNDPDQTVPRVRILKIPERAGVCICIAACTFKNCQLWRLIATLLRGSYY